MSGQRVSNASKPATEQPGNSFRYLYWRLSKEDFQQLCSSLLRLKYGSVRCFPVGMADEGIDAIADDSVIFQVKWSSKLLQDPASWLGEAIEGERAKIIRLVREKRISRYILMTSVAGTTTGKGTGSIQVLQQQLDKYSKEFRVPVECWWQSDIDAEVDAAPDSVKWSYQEMLAGEDAKIKFSQVDMDRVNIADMFVDVQAAVLHPQRQDSRISGVSGRRRNETVGALASLLQPADPLKPSPPLIFLLGVPGQGKSTLGQYLSQVHRAGILPAGELAGRRPPAAAVADPKLPLRVDLADYASWLSG